jgi:hypothetical protein
MECRVCRVDKEADFVVEGVCPDCADTLGVAPLPPPRRPALPCQRCNNLRFTRVVPREITDTGGSYNHQAAAPMGLSYSLVTTGPGLFSAKHSPEAIDYRKALGIVEAYVCASCGFVEWYCHDPASIPVGPEHMADVVDYASTEPYR